MHRRLAQWAFFGSAAALLLSLAVRWTAGPDTAVTVLAIVIGLSVMGVLELNEPWARRIAAVGTVVALGLMAAIAIAQRGQPGAGVNLLIGAVVLAASAHAGYRVARIEQLRLTYVALVLTATATHGFAVFATNYALAAGALLTLALAARFTPTALAVAPTGNAPPVNA